jgi:hypothetical protein
MTEINELASYNSSFDIYFSQRFGNAFLGTSDFSVNKNNFDIIHRSSAQYEQILQNISFSTMLMYHDYYLYIWNRLNSSDCVEHFQKSLSLQGEMKNITKAFSSLFPLDFRQQLRDKLVERIQFVADETLSINNLQNLAQITGVDPQVCTIHDRFNRNDAFYKSLARVNSRYRLNASALRVSKEICSETILPPPYFNEGIYSIYRNENFIRSRPGIRMFDVGVSELMNQHKLEMHNGHKIVINKKCSKYGSLLQSMKELVESWDSMREPVEPQENNFMSEIYAAIERISWHYDIYQPNSINYPNWLKSDNIGKILHIGTVLTEATRKVMVDSGIAKAAFRKAAQNRHPDVPSSFKKFNIPVSTQFEVKFQEEAFKRINNAYGVITNPDKFQNWLNGVPLDNC